jgi:hypothetical protein
MAVLGVWVDGMGAVYWDRNLVGWAIGWCEKSKEGGGDDVREEKGNICSEKVTCLEM